MTICINIISLCMAYCTSVVCVHTASHAGTQASTVQPNHMQNASSFVEYHINLPLERQMYGTNFLSRLCL